MAFMNVDSFDALIKAANEGLMMHICLYPTAKYSFPHIHVVFLKIPTITYAY